MAAGNIFSPASIPAYVYNLAIDEYDLTPGREELLETTTMSAFSCFNVLELSVLTSSLVMPMGRQVGSQDYAGESFRDHLRVVLTSGLDVEKMVGVLKVLRRYRPMHC